MARVLLELQWVGARGRTWVHSWHMQNVQRIEVLLWLDNIHLRVAEVLVREVVGHMLDVVEVVPHSFASPMAVLELPGVDCKVVVGFFAPSGGHTLALVAHALSVLCPALSPTFLVLADLCPSASPSLFPALSPSLACPYHSIDCASLRMQACHKSLLGVLDEQDRPSCYHQTHSHCASVGGDFRIFEVEGAH